MRRASGEFGTVGGMADRVQAFIGGEWVGASDGATFDSLDPATGDVLATVPAWGGPPKNPPQ